MRHINVIGWTICHVSKSLFRNRTRINIRRFTCAPDWYIQYSLSLSTFTVELFERHTLPVDMLLRTYFMDVLYICYDITTLWPIIWIWMAGDWMFQRRHLLRWLLHVQYHDIFKLVITRRIQTSTAVSSQL